MAEVQHVDGYNTPFVPGLYRVYWGAPNDPLAGASMLVSVVQLTPNKGQLSAYTDEGKLLGYQQWPTGPNEMLTDPLRVLLDPCQPLGVDEGGDHKHLTELGHALGYATP